MRRRHSFFDHKSGLSHHKVEHKRISKKTKAFLVLGSILVIFVGVLIYLGVSFSSAAGNILNSRNGFSFKDLAGKSALKQTDGVTNILVLGKGGSGHPGGQLTDTMILVRINQSDKRIAMVSLPRDLQIKLPGGGINKLNYAFTYGWEKEKDQNKKNDAGAQTAVAEVQEITGVPVHYYTVVDFVGFKELVDTLGGVTVNVEKDIYDPMYPKDSFDAKGNYVKTDAYQTFSLKAGEQKLDGTTALKYARSRETTSDFDRAKRQQKLLLAIKEKALSLGVLTNPVKISELMQDVGNHVKTSFNASELKGVVDLAKNTDQSKIINKVLDNDPKTGLLISVNEGGYYLKTKSGNFKEIQAMIKGIFGTSSSTSTVSGTTTANSAADIEVWNGSGTKGSGGTLADKLKKAGLNITKIDTNPEIIDETTIYDGTNGSKDFNLVKQKVGKAKVVAYKQPGVIKIIIGRDYGN